MLGAAQPGTPVGKAALRCHERYVMGRAASQLALVAEKTEVTRARAPLCRRTGTVPGAARFTALLGLPAADSGSGRLNKDVVRSTAADLASIASVAKIADAAPATRCGAYSVPVATHCVAVIGVSGAGVRHGANNLAGGARASIHGAKASGGGRGVPKAKRALARPTVLGGADSIARATDCVALAVGVLIVGGL